jgi:hypothetical protein
MIRSDSNDQLVRALGADLTPVRRLAPPAQRVLVWLATVAAVAIALASVSNLGAMVHRFAAAPDLGVAAAGSMLTAVLAAVAAFELSLPDRKPVWALLPLPAAALWICASGIGCLRQWVVPGTHPASLGESENCLLFIFGLSIPLSILLIVMLRRGCSLRPNLTAIVGGLACASAAASLLNFIHPYDATASDLAIHALAVGLVVLVSRIFGGRLLMDRDY